MSPLGLLLLALASRLTAAAAGPRGFSRASGDLVQKPKPGPCRHAGDEVNSVAARAFLAEHVLVAKVRTKSQAREPGGRYAVTFVVVRNLRKPPTLPSVLGPGKPIRLPFRSKIHRSRPHHRNPMPCQQNYNFTSRQVVRADIKQGARYLLFLTGQGPLNFSLLGEPVISKQKNVNAVKTVLQNREEGMVRGLEDVMANEEEKVRLICKARGNPLPAISWYKNDLPLKVSKNVRILYKQKRSVLVLVNVTFEDAGKYECRGTDVGGKITSTTSMVTVAPRQHTLSYNETTRVKTCAVDYCHNGATCVFYIDVSEMVCLCADGFKGVRCENKDVYNHSSMYRPMSYFCKLGISSSYYC